MIRRDPKHERTWVILTDGERALQRRVIKTFENVTLVLDLLHVLDKLWKAAHVLHPEGSHEAEAFVRHRAERILCGMAGQVLKGLRQTVTKRRLTGQKAKTIRGATGSSAPACAGRSRPPKRSYDSAPRTSPTTSTTTGKHHIRTDQQRLYRKHSWQPVLK